jgi:hypothetical protein
VVSGDGEGFKIENMQKLSVKVIPKAKKEKIVEENGRLKIYVNAPAVDGKANKALIEVLAKHFGVKKRDISILTGEKSRTKIIGIRTVVTDLLNPR